MANYNSGSPPPLQHPVPTHPAFIPEPPSTPGSPQGYQRYASSPPAHAVPGMPQGPSSAFAQGNGRSQYAQPPYQPMGNMAQHQSPMGHMQGSISPQQQHPHQQQQLPDFGAWGVNDATAQFGMQLGQHAVAAGQEYVQKNFGGVIPLTMLKHHFNVSNSYVIKKLQILLFPWRHSPWSRKIRRSEAGQTEWQPPRDDINSPDLYIPLMALVTYILVAAFHLGLQQRFHPQVLGALASKALAVVLLDFLIVKSGCYLLNVQGSGQVVDLVAYGGYKFVGVLLTLVAGLLQFGGVVYMLVFLYAFFSVAFFMLRSLRSVVLPDANSNVTVNPAQRKRRISFLFLEALSQIVYMAILVRV
ncbi:YIF1-domain-containing protein [Coniophora puteana RWD-64-598 SS2]|uniref:Protein YIF1 n=1 Tax=Coniophora puteana (strain RWD-64-598) TaxID=741705 RepID=A0A5M3MB69_CONPW|nr:YIF1-domain-containing protein [Coniophora puteana RWD-64-598 SS2]EIW76050.1 YIF1-domain-containing protein [Coniophora puteana RWD-64-598 SS2]